MRALLCGLAAIVLVNLCGLCAAYVAAGLLGMLP